MFGSVSPSRGRRTVSTRRLWLEALERRDCPSPVITGNSFASGNTFVAGNTPVDLNGAYATQQSSGQYAGQYVLNFHYTVSGSSVEFTGAVTAGTSSDVAYQVVEFEGAINGYVVTDGSGNFDFTTNAATQQNVTAAVVPETSNDGTMMPMPGPVQSAVLQDMLVANGTTITMAIAKMGPYEYQITGTVTGQNVGSLTVTFGGQPVSIQGKTTPVNADGTFSLFIEMDHGASDEGSLSAQILQDANGQPSNIAWVEVMDVGS